MSLNRTVRDLKVKSIKVEKFFGGSWIKPTESFFLPGMKYRLVVGFGNTGGRIVWDDERYRKDNVDIRIVAMGFPYRGAYYHKTKIVFYTGPSFSTQVSGAKYRTSFFADTFETTYADNYFYAAFKVKPGITSRAITTFRWSTGIYAGVRDRVWRKEYSTV